MGGKSALLADLEDEEDDKPSSLLADISAPDEPADTAPKGMRDVANYWESHYSDGQGNADEGSMLKGILGRLLGDVGNMASVGAAPAAQVGKGALAFGTKVAKDVATQGAAGAIQGAGQALQDGEDMSGMLKRILESGGISGALELGLNAIGGGAGKLGDGLEWAAKKAKNVVAGSNAAEARAILDKYGATADTNMLGALLDKYSPTGVFSPKSAAGHLEDAVAPQLQVQGQRVGQMIDKAGYDEGVNALVPGAHAQFQSNVDDRALEAMRRPAGGEQRDFAAAMADKADEVHAMSPPEDLAEFVRDKSGFQSSGAAKGAVGYAETARAKADQAVGGEAKGMIAELMGQAEPGTFARWDNARNQTHELSMLQEVLAAKKAGETTAGDIGSTIGSAVVGAGLGGAAGAMTGDNAVEGAGIGAGAALAGAFGLTGGATKTAVRQLGGTGLADFGANVARSGGNLARGMGGALEALPTGAIGGAAGDAMADESRGHQTYEVVEQALKANPRMLGSYGQRLAQAEDFKGEVSRLIDDDPNFARLVRNLQAAWK